MLARQTSTAAAGTVNSCHRRFLSQYSESNVHFSERRPKQSTMIDSHPTRRRSRKHSPTLHLYFTNSKRPHAVSTLSLIKYRALQPKADGGEKDWKARESTAIQTGSFMYRERNKLRRRQRGQACLRGNGYGLFRLLASTHIHSRLRPNEK